MRFSRSSVVSRSEKGGCEDLGENTVGVRLPEARPHPVPPHEHESRREPPHPDPLLHKCVEERKMERRARVLGINVGRRRIGGIRPNPTKSDLQRNGVVGGQWPVAKAGGRDRPNRAESNRIKPAAEMVEGGDYD